MHCNLCCSCWPVLTFLMMIYYRGQHWKGIQIKVIFKNIKLVELLYIVIFPITDCYLYFINDAKIYKKNSCFFHFFFRFSIFFTFLELPSLGPYWNLSKCIPLIIVVKGHSNSHYLQWFNWWESQWTYTNPHLSGFLGQYNNK